MLLPTEMKMKPNEELGIIRVCAWGDSLIGDDDKPCGDAPADHSIKRNCSHGICSECMDNKAYL